MRHQKSLPKNNLAQHAHSLHNLRGWMNQTADCNDGIHHNRCKPFTKWKENCINSMSAFCHEIPTCTLGKTQKQLQKAVRQLPVHARSLPQTIHLKPTLDRTAGSPCLQEWRVVMSVRKSVHKKALRASPDTQLGIKTIFSKDEKLWLLPAPWPNDGTAHNKLRQTTKKNHPGNSAVIYELWN